MRPSFCRFTITIIAAFVIGSSFAHAQLVLNLDTSAKTFWFTGSDSIVSPDYGDFGQVQWSAGGLGVNSVALDISLLISSTAPLYELVAPALSITNSGGNRVYLTVTFAEMSFANPITLTGLGESLSADYGSIPSFSQTVFESATSLALEFGTGGHEISIVHANAIPEPSTYAALAGLGALGVAAYRRRRQGLAR